MDTDVHPACEPPQPPTISVVVPVCDEEDNLVPLHARLSAVLDATGLPAEILFVNDGSTDRTPLLLDGLLHQDSRLVVLHLSRNFGHQAAVWAGIEAARGQAVIVMDGDLQDPPELIPQFLDRWQDGHDVVYAVRRRRKEGIFKRACYHVFYRILNRISEIDIPLDSGDFSLMDRRVVEALRSLPERRRFIRGLRTFVGFRQIGLPYERDARGAGKPKYTFRRLLGLAIDGLVSFSSYPLRLVTYLGLIAATIALGLTVWVLLDAFIQQTAPRGWASTVVVVLFMGSVQLISLGIIGEYVRLIFIETKERPAYIVASRRSGASASRPPAPIRANRQPGQTSAIGKVHAPHWREPLGNR